MPRQESDMAKAAMGLLCVPSLRFRSDACSSSWSCQTLDWIGSVARWSWKCWLR